MTTKTPVQVLNGYFNTGEGKVTATAFAKEIKELKEALGADGFREFAEETAKVSGEELRAA